MRPTLPTTIAANGLPKAEPVALYVGDVMHARLKPVGHRFVYKVFTILVDLDRLPDADRSSWLFGVDRFAAVSFHQVEHGERIAARADRPLLRQHVDRLLAARQMPRPDRLFLLCYPRIFGFVFNPLSVYFACSADGTVTALIYEVRNTFGEMHTYVAPVQSGEAGPDGIRQERAKLFYVSPFVDMAMRYRFRILPPGEAVRVRILETDADGPLLAATFAGRHATLTTATLTRLLVAMPFLTLKVVAGIHWEAAKLWFKGVRFFHRPPRPTPVSYRDGVIEPAASGYRMSETAP
jgi:hypothetical protein